MLTMTPDTTEFTATVCRHFTIAGMTGNHGQRAIATEIGTISGVTLLAADAVTGKVVVESTHELELADVAAAVDKAGYELVG